MTDVEFEIIDELYFVTSFPVLLRNVSVSEEELVVHLKEMIMKGWVRCLINIEGEESDADIVFQDQYMNYYYLASKEGLKLHNSV